MSPQVSAPPLQESFYDSSEVPPKRVPSMHSMQEVGGTMEPRAPRVTSPYVFGDAPSSLLAYTGKK